MAAAHRSCYKWRPTTIRFFAATMGIPQLNTPGCSRYQVFKKIKLRAQRPEIAAGIRSEYNVIDVVARVLAARGFLLNQELHNFINPTLKEGLPAPDTLKNLREACALIASVHRAGKPIAICCDFDVDGLSGGSLVHSFFLANGIASKVFVPDRFADGYGLHERVVREIAAAGFGLLLTIDFGTTNSKELEVARSLGLKSVVVDHHHTGGSVPCADVFVNPQQDGCGFAGKILCAAGLAWYLVVGLKAELKLEGADARSYLDLACLGTICDMVPLIGANRIIAKRGLELLGVSKRPGLQALRNVAGMKSVVGCTDVSFGIGPRLNAAGRIENGNLVIELLTTKDSVRADKIARQLNELNLERQEIEGSVREQAIRMIEDSGGPTPGLVVWDESFHTGVIGIVAQRLVETFYRPAAVMGVDAEGIFKGSVRGIKGISVVETLASLKDLLIKYGGHDGAGGFSISADRLEDFREAFVAECERRLKSVETVPYAEADTEVQLTEMNLDLVEKLKNLAPFGMGNAAPQLLIKNLKVMDIRQLKGMHLKVLLSDGTRYLSGLMWRQSDHPFLRQNAKVNIVCRADSSTYQGATEVVANLQAVEAAG